MSTCMTTIFFFQVHSDGFRSHKKQNLIIYFYQEFWWSIVVWRYSSKLAWLKKTAKKYKKLIDFFILLNKNNEVD